MAIFSKASWEKIYQYKFTEIREFLNLTTISVIRGVVFVISACLRNSIKMRMSKRY